MKTESKLPNNSKARPFLKWAGGKGQLLEELTKRVQLATSTGRYFEPFVGGGALFFHLSSLGLFHRKNSFLSDANPNLIDTYLAVRDEVDELVELLRAHAAKHSETHYYKVRAKVPEGAAQRAARIIYLNKTCFNGLYRENSKGGFNVPMGRYKNPSICDEDNLRAVSALLTHANIRRAHFSEVLSQAKKGDFVYFDPPYWPVSATSSFTAYAKDNFGKADQEQLAEVFAALTKKGVFALLSNSDAPEVNALYREFNIERVLASRNVNSKAAGRGKVLEVLVRNF